MIRVSVVRIPNGRPGIGRLGLLGPYRMTALLSLYARRNLTHKLSEGACHLE